MMGCTVCAAPLFSHEHPLGLCRTHGLAGTTLHKGLAVLTLAGTVEVEPWYRRDRINSLRDLGSILPPIPPRNSVRLVHCVLTPTEDELRAVVAEHQALTPAMRAPRDLVLNMPKVDPHTREAVGREDRRFRIVER
jgi:hypothetical protein